MSLWPPSFLFWHCCLYRHCDTITLKSQERHTKLSGIRITPTSRNTNVQDSMYRQKPTNYVTLTVACKQTCRYHCQWTELWFPSPPPHPQQSEAACYPTQFGDKGKTFTRWFTLQEAYLLSLSGQCYGYLQCTWSKTAKFAINKITSASLLLVRSTWTAAPCLLST